jgi:hypothetical protein
MSKSVEERSKEEEGMGTLQVVDKGSMKKRLRLQLRCEKFIIAVPAAVNNFEKELRESKDGLFMMQTRQELAVLAAFRPLIFLLQSRNLRRSKHQAEEGGIPLFSDRLGICTPVLLHHWKRLSPRGRTSIRLSFRLTQPSLAHLQPPPLCEAK